VHDRARFLLGKPLRWLLASPQAVEDASVVAFSAQAARIAQDESGAPDLSDNPFVRIGQSLMEQAVAQRASDLHIQPYLGAFVVRIRVDGELRRLVMLQETVALTLIRHLKVRSGMDPTHHLVPQDGRMSLAIAGRDFELRVSTLPASRGERLVIRFLDQGRVHRLGSAGFSLAALQTLRRSVVRPSGLVILTGPTGSGKTSTLYGLLAEVNHPTVNIITVENPVEYRLAGISQVEVNDKAGMSFNAALRSILRQDPDVVLVGEIRDSETAQIAAQATLTGHLVLSTLHTSDAVSTIPRLLNLGVEPAILADSLSTIVAQRLCRMLCVHCRQPVTEPLTPAERRYEEVTRNRPGYRASGCAKCDHTGFHGRLPIVDIIEMNRPLRDAIAAGESRLDALERLRSGGLKSLAASGSHRIISGDTTVSEVAQSVGPAFWPELAAHHGTACPDEGLDLEPLHVVAGQGVLLIGRDSGLAERLRGAVEAIGLRLLSCDTPGQAQALLRRDEEIAFILGDVPEAFGAEELRATLQEFRLHVSWSRLPTLVLLPPALADQEEALRRSGSLAQFLHKPVDPETLVQHIRRAQAR
jgi:type II secretory ATPase GspE/PulE/Tfp pilus assembly ATPase PilB-like protein